MLLSLIIFTIFKNNSNLVYLIKKKSLIGIESLFRTIILEKSFQAKNINFYCLSNIPFNSRKRK